MQDKIDEMVKVGSKFGTIHTIQKDLKRIFKKADIFTGKPKMEFKCHHRKKSGFYCGCLIKPEDNIFGERLEIVIKPEHSEHRALRVIVSLANKVELLKLEDEDIRHPDMNDKQIFKEELKELERDILKEVELLKKTKKQVSSLS